MDWVKLIEQIFEVCVIPLLGILVGFIIDFIKVKKEEAKAKTKNELVKKYIDILADVIQTCVVSTNQTYVDALKAEGKFDAEAQKIAFQKTYDNIISTLSAEAKSHLTEFYGDLTLYITNQIEESVHWSKR